MQRILWKRWYSIVVVNSCSNSYTFLIYNKHHYTTYLLLQAANPQFHPRHTPGYGNTLRPWRTATCNTQHVHVNTQHVHVNTQHVHANTEQVHFNTEQVNTNTHSTYKTHIEIVDFAKVCCVAKLTISISFNQPQNKSRVMLPE